MKNLIIIVSVFLIISCMSNINKQETMNVDMNPELSAQTEPVMQKSDVSEKTYSLNDININLTQNKGNGKDFYCKSRLLIYRNNVLIDSLKFTPEPVGGHYGISKPIRIDDHLIFTKHGDYDGRTIIVNDKGKIFNIIGGKNFYDTDEKLLFTIYESDLGGFAVFDLKNDLILVEMQELEHIHPISFHKIYGQRYFILCNNDEADIAIWEIEFDLERIMWVDLDREQLNDENILKTWELKEVNCQ